MPKCTVHIDFFHDDCNGCKEEYKEMKGISEVSGLSATEPNNNYDSTQAYKGRTYKEFTEERAKKLYGELLIQYLKNLPHDFFSSFFMSSSIHYQGQMAFLTKVKQPIKIRRQYHNVRAPRAFYFLFHTFHYLIIIIILFFL
jgi:hypothetical protein